MAVKKKKAAAQTINDLKIITLPKPSLTGGKTVLLSLQKRKTTRSISSKKLPLQALSNLFWAACGVNRRKGPFGGPGLTAGSASNSQEINVYAAFEDGVYLYEPIPHKLIPVAAGDFRGLAIGKGQGHMGAQAPVRLIYVVDIHKFSKAGFPEPGLYDPEIQKAYYFVDTGLIAGNVYLFAASQGLATWFHNCDKAALAAKLNLRPEQRLLFGQTVGDAQK